MSIDDKTNNDQIIEDDDSEMDDADLFIDEDENDEDNY